MTSFFSLDELKDIGFHSLGDNILISRKASIYSPEKISIGNNVRIDDFCILSGNINIESNIHISAYCALYGSMGIVIKSFSGLSPRCTVFSACDDFGGDFLVGPVHPEELTNVTGGTVIIDSYVQLGACTTVMPNIKIGQGAVTGAFTLVRKSLDPWTINIGIPARFLRKRSKGLLTKIY